MKQALKSSNIVLVVIAIATFFVSLNPPKLLGIFGQVGVYGLVLAAVPPLVTGVLFSRVHLPSIWILSVLGMALHFILYIWGETLFPNSGLSFSNPGVTAAIGLLASCIPALAIGYLYNQNKNALAKQ